jgi:hypothetical protein
MIKTYIKNPPKKRADLLAAYQIASDPTEWDRKFNTKATKWDEAEDSDSDEDDEEEEEAEEEKKGEKGKSQSSGGEGGRSSSASMTPSPMKKQKLMQMAVPDIKRPDPKGAYSSSVNEYALC